MNNKKQEQFRKRMKKIREANRVKISSMRTKGKTLEHIGKVVGLTRERVRQIERLLGFPARGYKTSSHVEKKCGNPKCKKILSLSPSNVARQFCSSACYSASIIPPTLEEKRAGYRRRMYKYYHTVLKFSKSFKAKTKVRNKAYSEKIKRSKKVTKK